MLPFHCTWLMFLLLFPSSLVWVSFYTESKSLFQFKVSSREAKLIAWSLMKPCGIAIMARPWWLECPAGASLLLYYLFLWQALRLGQQWQGRWGEAWSAQGPNALGGCRGVLCLPVTLEASHAWLGAAQIEMLFINLSPYDPWNWSVAPHLSLPPLLSQLV